MTDKDKKLEWEFIQESSFSVVDRLEIPEGWLYRVGTKTAGSLEFKINIVFAPKIKTVPPWSGGPK